MNPAASGHSPLSDTGGGDTVRADTADTAEIAIIWSDIATYPGVFSCHQLSIAASVVKALPACLLYAAQRTGTEQRGGPVRSSWGMWWQIGLIRD